MKFFFCSGIYRDIRIVGYSTLLINFITFQQFHREKDVLLRISVFVRTASEGILSKLSCRLQLKERNGSFVLDLEREPILQMKGETEEETRLDFEITVENPK